jgi:signal transduction histidine kinase
MTTIQTICKQLTTLLLHDDARACDVPDRHSDLRKATTSNHASPISKGIGSFDFTLARTALLDAGAPFIGVTGATWAQPNPKKEASILVVNRPLQISIDPLQIQQAIGGLSSNAYKYSQGSGDVTIRENWAAERR